MTDELPTAENPRTVKIREYRWKKGQSGNPNGRPKGTKTLKTFAQEYLKSLNDDEKLDFMKELPQDLVWRMAEGNPHQGQDITSGGKPIPIFGGLSSGKVNPLDPEISEHNSDA